jgi:hypothetical protein
MSPIDDAWRDFDEARVNLDAALAAGQYNRAHSWAIRCRWALGDLEQAIEMLPKEPNQ